MIYISKHFSYSEVIRSQLAARNNIDNNISDNRIIENARNLAEKVLEPIRAHFGRPFSPSSWYRCEELEKALCYNSYVRWANNRKLPVNSATWSDYFSRKSHPKGNAADIQVPTVSNDDLYAWIHKNLKFDQLIREFPKRNDPYSGWVHVSFEVNGNRGQAFTIT